MQHFIKGENVGLTFIRNNQGVEKFSHIYITKEILDAHIHPGLAYTAPLYLCSDSGEKVPNLDPEIWRKIDEIVSPSQKGGTSFAGGVVDTTTIFTDNATTPSFGHPFKEGEIRKLGDLPYNSALKERARELRKAGNYPEVQFWLAVKSKKFMGLDFDRQRVIGNYIVDFYCHEKLLVIEIDGSSHNEKEEYDKSRDEYLKSLGLNVLHFSVYEINENIEGVLKKIQEFLTTPSFRHPSKEGETKTKPEDILDYIYAVLHSPIYRQRYKEFLKIDFPRVPYPSSSDEFWRFTKFGTKLRKLHLMEDPDVENLITSYPVAGSDEVGKVRFETTPSFGHPFKEGETGRVWINETQYFDQVPDSSWNFYIGGYQPAQKWLKDRKLNNDEIEHYQKIIKVLHETERVMEEIE